MLFKLSLGDEGSSTAFEAASIGSLAFMFKEMVSESSFSGELKVAFGLRANKGSFFGMDSHMIFKGISTLEGFVAAILRAGIRSVVGMNTLMSDDGRFEAKDLSAVREGAFEDFLVLIATLLVKIFFIVAKIFRERG